MAHAIRLTDIDLDAVRYIPGNQWAEAGTKVLYPGYLTPQAFDALGLLPAPDVSTTTPSTPPTPPAPITKPSDLQIVYKNNVSSGVSIDYMGGAGTLVVDTNFHPKPTVKTGYSVDAVTTAVAVMQTKTDGYNNATIQAVFYDSTGKPTIHCNYYFEYKNNAWTKTDKGSSKEAQCVMVGNIAYVFLTEENIQKVDFKYSELQTNCLQAIADFQGWKDTGLMPNVIHYDHNYTNPWEENFSFDASRFPLWSSAYIRDNPHSIFATALKGILQQFLTSLQSHIEKGAKGFTLPSGGVNAITGENVGNFDTTSQAINAPIYAAYKLMNDATVAGELEEAVLSYDISTVQPNAKDPIDSSTPYFNAVMTLISQAVIEGKL